MNPNPLYKCSECGEMLPKKDVILGLHPSLVICHECHESIDARIASELVDFKITYKWVTPYPPNTT